MSEKPILFKSEMVRAILAGRKTQTRRIIKPQPFFIEIKASDNSIASSGWAYETPKLQMSKFPDPAVFAKVLSQYSPYGQIGDRLWVRETFCDTITHEVWYRADSDAVVEGVKWKPSIFMRRKDSRITLEITEIRAERLHDISQEDCIAEGCPGWYHPMHPDFGETDGRTPREEYAELWIAINGKESFDANPWVWVIEFKVLALNQGKK